MDIDELRAYVIEQLKMYEQIANADRRLAVCRESLGRIACLRDLLKKIDGENYAR